MEARERALALQELEAERARERVAREAREAADVWAHVMRRARATGDLGVTHAAAALPPALFDIPGIQRWSITNTPLTSLPDAFCAERHAAIRDMCLSNNALTSLPPSLAACAPALQRLAINNNNFTVLPDVVTSLVHVTLLEVHNNHLRRLPDGMRQLVNISRLVLDCNDLSTLPPSLAALPHLTVLSLNFNSFKALPACVAACRSLESVSATSNRILEFPAHLVSLPSLHCLELSSNQICELPLSVGDFPCLRELALAHNQIRELPTCMSKLTSLTRLMLDGNPLHTPPLPFLLERGLKGLNEWAHEEVQRIRKRQLQARVAMFQHMLQVVHEQNLASPRYFRAHVKVPVQGFVCDCYAFDWEEFFQHAWPAARAHWDKNRLPIIGEKTRRQYQEEQRRLKLRLQGVEMAALWELDDKDEAPHPRATRDAAGAAQRASGVAHDSALTSDGVKSTPRNAHSEVGTPVMRMKAAASTAATAKMRRIFGVMEAWQARDSSASTTPTVRAHGSSSDDARSASTPPQAWNSITLEQVRAGAGAGAGAGTGGHTQLGSRALPARSADLPGCVPISPSNASFDESLWTYGDHVHRSVAHQHGGGVGRAAGSSGMVSTAGRARDGIAPIDIALRIRLAPHEHEITFERDARRAVALEPHIPEFLQPRDMAKQVPLRVMAPAIEDVHHDISLESLAGSTNSSATPQQVMDTYYASLDAHDQRAERARVRAGGETVVFRARKFKRITNIHTLAQRASYVTLMEPGTFWSLTPADMLAALDQFRDAIGNIHRDKVPIELHECGCVAAGRSRRACPVTEDGLRCRRALFVIKCKPLSSQEYASERLSAWGASTVEQAGSMAEARARAELQRPEVRMALIHDAVKLAYADEDVIRHTAFEAAVLGSHRWRLDAIQRRYRALRVEAANKYVAEMRELQQRRDELDRAIAAQEATREPSAVASLSMGAPFAVQGASASMRDGISATSRAGLARLKLGSAPLAARSTAQLRVEHEHVCMRMAQPALQRRLDAIMQAEASDLQAVFVSIAREQKRYRALRSWQRGIYSMLLGSRHNELITQHLDELCEEHVQRSIQMARKAASDAFMSMRNCILTWRNRRTARMFHAWVQFTQEQRTRRGKFHDALQQ